MDKGDGFVGIAIGFPGADRETVPNPTSEGGEELKGMFKIGALRDGREEGVPLSVCCSSTSSCAKGLGIGTGSLGGVEPVSRGGLDNVSAEGRAPAVMENALLSRFPGGVLGGGDLIIREPFEVLRIVSVTEHITHLYAMGACLEWFHVFLTLKDEIQDHVTSIDS